MILFRRLNRINNGCALRSPFFFLYLRYLDNPDTEIRNVQASVISSELNALRTNKLQTLSYESCTRQRLPAKYGGVRI